MRSIDKIYQILNLEFFGVCVFDNPVDRVLKSHFYSSQEMTIEICLSICRDRGFDYSGLEWQIECYCGDEPTKGFELAWFGKCDQRCAGNTNQICGGSHALSIYKVRGFHKSTY